MVAPSRAWAARSPLKPEQDPSPLVPSSLFLSLSASALLATVAPLRAEAAAEPPAELPAAGAEPAVETLTVTARRRSEDAQAVPAAISVLGARTLDEQRLYQVQELQQALPNVTAQFLHARQSSVSVRGIGNNTANEGLEGSVGVYLDNVLLGRPGQAVFDLLDLEQVELLRGPQGTLFGKNTTAGVLNITTRAPAFTPEATVEASAGNRHYTQLKAMYSGPLSATAAFRLSASATHDDGWVRNVARGETLNEVNRRSLRTQLLLRPDAAFSLRLIAEHHEERSSTGALVPYAYAPLNRGPFKGRDNPTDYGRWAALLGASPVVADPDRYEVALDAEQRADAQQDALSAQADWRLGELRLSSITAWRSWRFDPKNDLDMSALPGMTGGSTTRQRQFSQELRLAGPGGTALDWVVGAYYWHEAVYSRNHYATGSAGSTLSGGTYPAGNAISGRGDAASDSLALFGHGTLHLDSGLDLGAGLRATSERKQGRVRQNGLEQPSPYGALPMFSAWDSGALERRDDGVAALLSASTRWNAATLLYATLSHGEKSGGYNVNSVASPGSAFGVGAITVRPEQADNLELGFKSTLAQRRLRFNANLFVTKVHDYQAVTTRYYAPIDDFLAVLGNVGDLTSRGLEFELAAQATPALAFSLAGAYTRAVFDEGVGPARFERFDGAYGRGAQSLAGNEVNGAPRWTVALGTQWRRHVADGVEFHGHAAYAWRSAAYGDINNSSYSRIPAYGLLNLGAGLRLAAADGGGWDLSLWLRNALDQRHYLGVTAQGNNAYYASAGAPRSAGLSLRYDFF
ncbi:TonB-dependent receptor [Rubrivivax gelatinosus]|uniref:TonB-dependent receptor n=1 Tax=Rubrivivax gelatinosus TaxID=28068 RepID=A0ABS1DVW8_RUBGE|nr:TonB-dependent receptor [Rubrivivax gelatinosus]